jgi:hypothetical protein
MDLTCSREIICKNFPNKCDICRATSDLIDNYHCYTSKDLVEVVRCKDCEHFYQVGDVMMCRHWNYHSTKDDAYCSFAKMKGGAE